MITLRTFQAPPHCHMKDRLWGRKDRSREASSEATAILQVRTIGWLGPSGGKVVSGRSG